MPYNDLDKQKALEAFLQIRTIDGTAKALSLPYSTVRKWSLVGRWKEALEKFLDEESQDPFNTAVVERFASQFNVPEEEKKILDDIHVIEGICIACMNDPEETVEKTFKGLKPRSFVEAVNAIEKCAKMRFELFRPSARMPGTGVPGDGKMPWIDKLLVIHNNRKNENTPE